MSRATSRCVTRFAIAHSQARDDSAKSRASRAWLLRLVCMSLVWRPMFGGEEAARILAIVGEIADATAGGPFALPENVPPELAPIWQHGLDGLAGQSLLQAYLALHGESAARAATAIELLDRATDAAGALALPPSLYFGFCGISWVAAHLSGRLFEETQDNGREVDETLLAALDNSAWNARYELLDGVVGIGVYGLERLPRPSAVRLVEAVVERLDALAERSPAGAAFFTPVEHLDPAYREASPHGLYNLGMAQGVAGVIAFLGSACRAAVGVERARPLLAETIAWLMARERARDDDRRFSNTYTPGEASEISRLGWCHGDLAVATALLVAARGAAEPAWETHARRVARSAATRPVDNIPDAGLCHGAAGVGHLFNRLSQETGEPVLGEAARRWLSQAVAMREPTLGIGGYRMSQRGAQYDSPGFRVGSSGIALALLASVSSVAPDWDRLLMAS